MAAGQRSYMRLMRPSPPPSVHFFLLDPSPPPLVPFPQKQKPSEASHHSRKELQFLHTPIVDASLVSKEALAPVLADFKRRLEAGEKLYIHCS